MTNRTIRIGTRASLLARWQADHVQRLLQEAYPDVRWEQVLISTTGDRDKTAPLAGLGGVGVFTKEIEDALREGRVDMAVHSLKDLPSAQPEGLRIGAVLPREDPRDALVAVGGMQLDELPEGARVATSSVRRRAQLLHVRPDLAVAPIRGNVPTRLRKLVAEELDAIVLARAGLVRLGRENSISEVLPASVMMPAPGQGAIAVEIRSGDDVAEIVHMLHDEPTAQCVTAERALMRALGTGCNMPLGALATRRNGELHLSAVVASQDGRTLMRREAVGLPEAAEALGELMARELVEAGARAVLNALDDGENTDDA